MEELERLIYATDKIENQSVLFGEKVKLNRTILERYKEEIKIDERGYDLSR